MINQLDARAGDEELDGTLRSALADRLRITKANYSPGQVSSPVLGHLPPGDIMGP